MDRGLNLGMTEVAEMPERRSQIGRSDEQRIDAVDGRDLFEIR
jgi:hypothetical protein